jgi:hypothetical protein
MTKSYSGEEFAKALSEGSLRDSIVRVGMVKMPAQGSGVILFAEGECTDWIEVPVELIEEVTHLSTANCRDHEHPLVAMRFKEPVGDPAAQLFADLARRSAPPPVVAGEGPMQELPPGAVFRQHGDVGPGDSGTGPLERCKCLVPGKLQCHVEYIRIGPNFHIPILRCSKPCLVWECSPQ